MASVGGCRGCPAGGPYRLAVRKLIRGKRALRELYLVSTVSFVLAAIGYALYLLVFPSDVILIEAFVWLLEGISFLGLAIAFKVASSKALAYRARFEILRLEALSTLLAGILAASVVVLVVWKSITHKTEEPTPPLLASYPLASAAVSFVLERHLHRTMHSYEVRLASVRAVASKLGLDVVFELAGGLSILASNAFGDPLAERALVVSVGAYVLYGIALIMYEAVMYLVGPGPQGEVERVRGMIHEALKGSRYPVRHVKVEMYGTFGEAEVWLEAPADMSLAQASRESVAIARKLVRAIPELLRALVIMVPRQPAGRARGLKREHAQQPPPRQRAKTPPPKSQAGAKRYARRQPRSRGEGDAKRGTSPGNAGPTAGPKSPGGR